MEARHGLLLVSIELELISLDAILVDLTASRAVVIEASVVATQAVATVDQLLKVAQFDLVRSKAHQVVWQVLL